MVYDYKKECKNLYRPLNKPVIITIPQMNYIAIRGQGDPNEIEGAYAKALSKLYAVAYALKMSYKTDYKIEGFFEYVVPPLEGFWWQDDIQGVDYCHKEMFKWISLIRLPDFIKREHVLWAIEDVNRKKKMNCTMVEFMTIDEGLCVQMMHIGSYNDEPISVAIMDTYIKDNGYVNDFNDKRMHHEIYISDPRKTREEKRKTVIRHPIKKA